jgi:hypothetical protein
LSKSLWDSCSGLGLLNAWVDFPTPPLWTVRRDALLPVGQYGITFPTPTARSPSPTFGFFFEDEHTLQSSQWQLQFTDGSIFAFDAGEMGIKNVQCLSLSLHVMIGLPMIVISAPTQPTPVVKIQFIPQAEQAVIAGISYVHVDFAVHLPEEMPYAWTVSALGM